MTEPFYNFTLQKCNAYTVPQREGPRGRSPPPKYSIPKFVARFSTLDSVILTEGTNFAINYKEPRPVIYTRTHTHTHSLTLSLSLVQQPNAGQVRLILEVSTSHPQ